MYTQKSKKKLFAIVTANKKLIATIPHITRNHDECLITNWDYMFVMVVTLVIEKWIWYRFVHLIGYIGG